MADDRKLGDEAGRIAALKRLDVLDTPAEAQFDKITALVGRVLDVPGAAVTMIDATRQWFKSGHGIPVPEMPREGSFCTYAIRSTGPMVVANAALDERFRTGPAVASGMILSYAGAPLSTPDGYQVGTLCVFDSRPREFTAAQIDLLSRFAEIVMEQLQLRQLAQRDHLTGALTRRGLVARTEGEIAEARLTGRDSAMILFDIDHFKTINDRFGHGTGDEVLQRIGEICAATMPDHAFLGRVGGEEFAILLPRATAGDALAAAEAIRAAIAAAPMTSHLLAITASFGIAPLGETIASADDWLCAADAPMYAAKKDGRNLCRVAGERAARI